MKPKQARKPKAKQLPPLDLRAGTLAVRYIDAQIAGKRPKWRGAHA